MESRWRPGLHVLALEIKAARSGNPIVMAPTIGAALHRSSWPAPVRRVSEEGRRRRGLVDLRVEAGTFAVDRHNTRADPMPSPVYAPGTPRPGQAWTSGPRGRRLAF